MIIEIMGVKIPCSDKVLCVSKEIAKEYIDAIKKGKSNSIL